MESIIEVQDVTKSFKGDINTLCDTVHEMDHGILTEKEHISSECLDHNLKN